MAAPLACVVQHLADRLTKVQENACHYAEVQVGHDQELPDPAPPNNPRCCVCVWRGHRVSLRAALMCRRLVCFGFVTAGMLWLCDCRKRSRSSAGMTEAQTSLQHRVIQKDDFRQMQVLLLIDPRQARSCSVLLSDMIALVVHLRAYACAHGANPVYRY